MNLPPIFVHKVGSNFFQLNALDSMLRQERELIRMNRSHNQSQHDTMETLLRLEDAGNTLLTESEDSQVALVVRSANAGDRKFWV